LQGREVEPKMALRLLLYSYCSIFKISPNDAKDTPLELMLDMIHIHSEAEKIKAQEIERESKRLKLGK
jgi:hypothetical protein